jgi:hypothetical protein
VSDVETGPGAEKLKALKARIAEQRVAAFFKSPAELYGYVGDALRSLAVDLDKTETRPPAASAEETPPPSAASAPHPRVEDESPQRRALEIQERNLGREHPTTAAALQELGWFLGEGGDRAEAERLFRCVFTIREKTNGRDHPDTASALQGLGWALRMQGKYQEVEPLLRRAVEIRARTSSDS